MTKILVCSDSHGNTRALREALRARPELLDVIFLGDGMRDAQDVEDEFPQRRIYKARGNCDMGSYEPSEGLAPFGGLLVLYTHGHLYDVKTTRTELARAAAEKGADVALYGHTHTARTEECEGVLLCNPGALCGVRSGPLGASYGVLTIEEGVPRFEVYPLE